LILLWSCGDDAKPKSNETKKRVENIKLTRPDFSKDSAFAFIQKQIDFGPRVPNTKAHKEAGNYLAAKLRSFDFEVIEQEGQVEAYTGEKLNMKNIIGSYKSELNNRILLYSHWDSRPFADQDTKDKDKAIDGANDGASGVGILLEIARQIQIEQPEIGLDIIFFDAEDYGENSGELDTWCLGSQYWANNPHIMGYSANFGILLDMVGASKAKFTKEAISMYYAAAYVNLVWNNAAELGHQDHFISKPTQHVGVDDHFFVNKLANIPSIDIIQYDNTTKAFAPHWHTHDDTIEVIDKETLEAVGETVLATVLQEAKSVQ